MIMIMIALKGAIRDFYNLLTAPRTVSNTYAQVVKAQSCANHVQHIERLPVQYVCHVVGRDSSAIKFDRAEIGFILALSYGLNHFPMKEGRKLEYPEKTPDDELQKMPRSKARKFKLHPTLEPALSHWWQARKAGMKSIDKHHNACQR